MVLNTSNDKFQNDPVEYKIRKHTLPQSLLLHLLPGSLITLFFFLIAPSLIKNGYPPILSLYLAILFILIPFELGFLFYQGKKRNGRYSLNGIVLFKERMPIGKMILIIISLFAWSGFVFTQLSRIDSLISESLFAWLPIWSFPENLFGDLSQYSKPAITLTFVAGFLFNGIAGPIVEEFYFRGYLLPRIPASRWWSPLINVLLFSLYHFFSPWQNLSRILAFLPLSYAVAWKRNVFLSMWAHCLLNTVGMIISFVF